MKSFRLKKILFLVSTFLFLPYLTLSAQIKPEPSNINNKSIFTSSIEKSIDYLYNLDFDKAKLELNKAIEADKENPAGYFYTAMVYWERILSNPYDKEAFNLFQDWTSKSIEVAEKRIKEKGCQLVDEAGIRNLREVRNRIVHYGDIPHKGQAEESLKVADHVLQSV